MDVSQVRRRAALSAATALLLAAGAISCSGGGHSSSSVPPASRGVSANTSASNPSITFSLVVSGGAATCLPHATGNVTVTSLGNVETLHLTISGLPPQTDFDFFIIQVPKAPFGLAWYQGDIFTDSGGNGAQDYVGRFSIETFIVAPGQAAAPVVFPSPPFPDAAINPATPPIQLYHLGVWFNSSSDAAKAGCASTVTPFNGTHTAGIQVLNSANFPDANGPLRQFNP
jgi:hypothetical protein